VRTAEALTDDGPHCGIVISTGRTCTAVDAHCTTVFGVSVSFLPLSFEMADSLSSLWTSLEAKDSDSNDGIMLKQRDNKYWGKEQLSSKYNEGYTFSAVEADDWACGIVLKQIQFTADDLDETQLAEYMDWENSFDDDYDDERTISYDWDDRNGIDDENNDDEDVYHEGLNASAHTGKEITFRSDMAQVVDSGYPTVPETLVPDTQSQEDDGGPAIFRSKYEFGSSIRPFCYDAITQDRHLENMTTEAVCPEPDVVKMVLEVLLGYESDIFSVSTASKEQGIHQDLIKFAFPTSANVPNFDCVLEINYVEATVTPLGKSIRTASLSSAVLTNMLSMFASTASDLLVCRQFINGIDEFKVSIADVKSPVVESTTDAHYASVLYLLNTVDAEIVKLDSFCMNPKRLFDENTDYWSYDKNLTVDSSLFSIDVPFRVGEYAIKHHDPPQTISLLGLYVLCQKWETLLHNAAAYCQAVYSLRAIVVINAYATSAAHRDGFSCNITGSGVNQQPGPLLSADSYTACILSSLHSFNNLVSLTEPRRTSTSQSTRIDGQQGSYSRFSHSDGESSESLCIAVDINDQFSVNLLFFRTTYMEILSAYLSSVAVQLAGNYRRLGPLKTQLNRNVDEISKLESFVVNNSGVPPGFELLPPCFELILAQMLESRLDLKILSSVHRSTNITSCASSIRRSEVGSTDLLSVISAATEAYKQEAATRHFLLDAQNETVNPALIIYGSMDETLMWIETSQEQFISDMVVDTGDFSKSAAADFNSHWRPHIAVTGAYNKAIGSCDSLTRTAFESILKWRTEKLILPIHRRKFLHTLNCSDSNDNLPLAQNRDGVTTSREPNYLHVEIKPLSDLLLTATTRGILKSCPQPQVVKQDQDTLSVLNFEDHLFGAVSAMEALNGIVRQNLSHVRASTDRDDDTGRTPPPFVTSGIARHLTIEPQLFRDRRQLAQPILAALSAARIAARNLLSVDYKVFQYLNLLQDIFLLRDPQVFQYIKDMILDDSSNEIIWQYGQMSQSPQPNPTSVVPSKNATSHLKKHISYNTWLICQAVASRIDLLFPANKDDVITSYKVDIDVDIQNEDDRSIPIVLSLTRNLRIDLIFAWPVRAVVTVSQLATYNKCLQVESAQRYIIINCINLERASVSAANFDFKMVRRQHLEVIVRKQCCESSAR
jgi:hypothetical protein